jgi:cation-transporting ATPase 13A3/4/5
VSSQDLVPGDVFEFSDPSLSLVPCDCILLSGDCIVNESMLTGLYTNREFSSSNILIPI